MYNTDFEKEDQEFAFLGNYRGIVVNNQDPMQAGRCQIRVMSVYDGVEDDCLPWAEYCDPFMQGQKGSGGFMVPDNETRVWVFFENGDHMQPVYFGGAPSVVDGPASRTQVVGDTPRYGVEYTKNRVINTPGGHLVELDDTPGDTRVRVVHKSGTQTIMYENGDMTEYVVGNYKRIVQGNLEEYVEGDSMKNISGNETQVVQGNSEKYVTGNTKEAVSGNIEEILAGNKSVTVNGNSVETTIGNKQEISNGNIDISSGGNINISAGGMLQLGGIAGAGLHSNANTDVNGATVNINTSAPAVPPVLTGTAADDFEPSDEFQNSVKNAAVLIDVAGPKAAWDEEGESIPAGWPSEETNDPVQQPAEINVEANPNAPLSPDCETIDKIDYNYRLSENFTLGQLSNRAVFAHSIRAQNGLSVSDIICNLKHLAVNILEPLRAKYPNIRINSGFRAGASNSQHNKGQAVDIQVPGAPASLYTDMAAWIAKNLPFDQFILEHGKSVWLHISYNSSGTQRGQKLTYWPKGSPQYKPGLVNYYDNKKRIA